MSASQITDKHLRDELAPKSVLVFDQSTSSRKVVFAALKELGVQHKNLHHASQMNHARVILKQEKPEIIVSEFEVHGQYGLVLLEEAKAIVDDLTFILATTTASEASVAEAAEEEVDGYVVKPFIGQKLTQYLKRTFLNKISPPPYLAKIHEGKGAIENRNLEQARELFNEALKIGEKPSLAHYYLGQMEELNEMSERPLKHYEKGLEFIPNHYKCLVAKFEYLDKVKKPEDAYLAVKELLSHYPITPQRLGRVIYLAIQTQNFDDVLEYFAVYQKLDHKPEKLQVIVKAALYTSAKFLLKQKKYDEAYQQFEKSILCSKRNPELISKAILEMLNEKQPQLARNLQKLFTQQDIITPLFKQMEFRIDEFRVTKTAVMRSGIKLIEDEEADAYVFKRVIHLLSEDGNHRLASKYNDIGNRLFPEEIPLAEQ